jgi:hypothetical protein
MNWPITLRISLFQSGKIPFIARGSSTIRAEETPCRRLRGVAGSAALAKEYGFALRAALNKNTSSHADLDSQAALQRIRDFFIEAIMPEVTIERTRAEAEKRELNLDHLQGEALIATIVQGESRLFHIDAKLSPFELNGESPYWLIGDGREAGIPFFQYLRSEFICGDPPALAEGVVTALWTLRFAIKVQHRNIGGRTQVVTLSDDGAIRDYDRNELLESLEIIGRAEAAIHDVQRTMRGAPEVETSLPSMPRARHSRQMGTHE